jgi:hypothetical protein
MPKSIHKSAEIHLKTIQHLKKSKQINNNCFLRSLGAGSVLGCQIGAKWTNMEPKGYQKGAKSCQNGAKGTKSAPKGNKKKQKITMFTKGRFKERSGRKNSGFLSKFARKCRPNGAFLELPKIANGTKIQLFSKDRHRDPLKTVPGSGFEET